MAGHSKWAQIKRGKAVTDAVKSRVFSRFARLIALESKKTGGSVTAPSLSAIIVRAKASNMPKENIERAVAKGMSKDAGLLEQVVYEVYGPGGVAIIVDALTDSRNRTTQEIKLILTEQELSLASPGAAAWAFTKAPDGSFAANEPLIEVAGGDEVKLGEILSKLDEQDDVQMIYTNARGYENTRD